MEARGGETGEEESRAGRGREDADREGRRRGSVWVKGKGGDRKRKEILYSIVLYSTRTRIVM